VGHRTIHAREPFVIRLLADLSLQTKAGPRIRAGLIGPFGAAARAHGWQFDVVVPAGVSLPPDAATVVHVLPNRSDLVLDEIVLPRLGARYDVVYTQREGLRAARRRRPRVVLQLHEHQHNRYAPWPTVRDAARGAVHVYRASRMYREADHICFSSAWTRDEFRRLEAAEPRSSSVVPLGGWPDNRADASHLPREPVVVVLASTDARDEFGWALDVWERAQLPAPWRMAVVGRPGAGDGSSVGDRVRLMGRISDDTLVDLLGRAGAYLHIGRTEGFGLSVVEALQLGTPVVARRGSAVDELLVSGGGFLVEDSTAAGRALADLARQTFTPAAVAAGARYSWAGTAASVIKACELALARSGRRP